MGPALSDALALSPYGFMGAAVMDLRRGVGPGPPGPAAQTDSLGQSKPGERPGLLPARPGRAVRVSCKSMMPVAT